MRFGVITGWRDAEYGAHLANRIIVSAILVSDSK
jgi:hypothetical protein